MLANGCDRGNRDAPAPVSPTAAAPAPEPPPPAPAVTNPSRADVPPVPAGMVAHSVPLHWTNCTLKPGDRVVVTSIEREPRGRLTARPVVSEVVVHDVAFRSRASSAEPSGRARIICTLLQALELQLIEEWGGHLFVIGLSDE